MVLAPALPGLPGRVAGVRRSARIRGRAIALIVARILAPGSKLATARGLAGATARDSLAEELGIETVDEDELYAAMDWLLERQGVIEQRLAKRHLSDGALVLHDVTSTYFEGRCCALARHGYSRDGKRGKLQIVFGLLCNREGCPVTSTTSTSSERCSGRSPAPETHTRPLRSARAARAAPGPMRTGHARTPLRTAAATHHRAVTRNPMPCSGSLSLALSRRVASTESSSAPAPRASRVSRQPRR